MYKDAQQLWSDVLWKPLHKDLMSIANIDCRTHLVHRRAQNHRMIQQDTISALIFVSHRMSAGVQCKEGRQHTAY